MGITESWLQRLLPTLEDAWREQSAPIADHLAPGATAEHLANIEQQAGIRIPPELCLLWKWHDGVTRVQPGTSLGVESRVVVGAWEFLSAAEAFQQRDWRIRIVVPDSYAAEPLDWEGWWDPHWLPFAVFDANALFVDVRQVTPAGTVPVRRYDHTPEDPFTPVTGSVSALLGVWVDALKRRYFWWSPEQGHGWTDPSEMPFHVRIAT